MKLRLLEGPQTSLHSTSMCFHVMIPGATGAENRIDRTLIPELRDATEIMLPNMDGYSCKARHSTLF